MLGDRKSRGYCLEMICADSLAGANLHKGNSNAEGSVRSPPTAAHLRFHNDRYGHANPVGSRDVNAFK